MVLLPLVPAKTVITTLVVLVPSLTLIVTVELPLWPLAVAIVTVRSEPLPPKLILPFGTSVVFDELALSVSALGDDS